MVSIRLTICGALRDLVPFVQFKKREKHPWRSVNSSKVNNKLTILFSETSEIYLKVLLRFSSNNPTP